MVAVGIKRKFYQNVARIFNVNVVAGRGRLLNIPHWWVFKQIERGTLLANSIKLLKQFGFVQYFFQQAHSNLLHWLAAGVN